MSAHGRYSADENSAFLTPEFRPRPGLRGAWLERPGPLSVILAPGSEQDLRGRLQMSAFLLFARTHNCECRANDALNKQV